MSVLGWCPHKKILSRGVPAGAAGTAVFLVWKHVLVHFVTFRKSALDASHAYHKLLTIAVIGIINIIFSSSTLHHYFSCCTQGQCNAKQWWDVASYLGPLAVSRRESLWSPPGCQDLCMTPLWSDLQTAASCVKLPFFGVQCSSSIAICIGVKKTNNIILSWGNSGINY